MKTKSIVDRYLDPAESLGEVLFGLIMALTFTVGARIITAEHELDTRELIIAAVGCNIAWGIIDAVLFVLGSMFHRSRRVRFLRALKGATSEADALATIREEFGLEGRAISLRPED